MLLAFVCKGAALLSVNKIRKKKIMKKLMIVATAALSMSALADFNIAIDSKAKPIKDIGESTCGPEVGYAGALVGLGLDDYWFVEAKDETARKMKEAGAYFQRVWGANDWWAQRIPGKASVKSNPEAVFKFWKENGFKALLTLEAWNLERDKKNILELVKFIVDNKYQDCVAGFELGNESYYHSDSDLLARNWTVIVPEILKIWPKAKLGIPLAELFENNPDLTQVRSRMLAAGEIKRDTYFAAASFNQNSARFIVGLSNVIDKITHVIYHAYGAETPYSCSYYGFKRFRNFNSAFPELKGKKMWLTEIRPRSDEDNRCQRIFREALVMAHYSLMAVAQADMDGFNHHQIYGISGGLYQSTGSSWMIQWRDEGGEYPDTIGQKGKPRMVVGVAGAMYRILAEGLKQHPIVLQHGTSKGVSKAGTDDPNFYTSAKVMDQVYARRIWLKEHGGIYGNEDKAPKVDGEVEYLVTATKNRGEYCVLMVNSKQTKERIQISLGGKQICAPTYRTLSCPAKYLDCREIPGEPHAWTTLSWEDTQFGPGRPNPMESYEKLKAKSDVLTIEIEPNTVQSVTFVVR